MTSPNQLNDFLDREKLEKAKLVPHFFLGGFFGLARLRELRVKILRWQATRLTNCGATHIANGDEATFQNQRFVGSFTKGLPHDDSGRVADPDDFKRFRVAIHTGDFFNDCSPALGRAEWRAVVPNGGVRGWESPEAGLTFEMHGPDSHSVTMPPAPALGTDQLTFEMAEVYWLALLRDVPFSSFQRDSDSSQLDPAIQHLSALPWMQNGMPTSPNLSRRQRRLNAGNRLDKQTIFRGVTPGDEAGPYLSQFMLIGTPGPENRKANITEGLIDYGAIKVDQRVTPAKADLDHMTTWDVFLDVQDAANLKGFDQFELVHPNGIESDKDEKSSEEFIKRFITTPRDLATYVHFDALYEAYLNACLILLGFRAPVDPGIRALNNRTLVPGGLVDGFALFGGPHVLNLVTEVATRALKAVRYQKFNIHCRLRPEALAGWMEAINAGKPEIEGIGALKQMYDVLNAEQGGINLLDEVRQYNGQQNTAEKNAMRPYLQDAAASGAETALLPMAFPEGSPMHPAYGAGHATVAGACVTMLKAFFDTDAVFVKRNDRLAIVPCDERQDGDQPIAYVPMLNESTRESELEDCGSSLSEPLTVGGELNKVAANISIGRNMAGVHYYTDYIDSLVMGEKISIGLLLEQSLAYEIYPDVACPSFSLTTFLGRELVIKEGRIFEKGQEVDWCDL